MDTHRRSLWLAVVAIPVVAALAWAAWPGGYPRFVWIGDADPPRKANDQAPVPNRGAESPADGLPLREHLPFIEVVPAAPGTHLVSGFVLDPSGEPAKGAEAILIESGAEESL